MKPMRFLMKNQLPQGSYTNLIVDIWGFKVEIIYDSPLHPRHQRHPEAPLFKCPAEPTFKFMRPNVKMVDAAFLYQP